MVQAAGRHPKLLVVSEDKHLDDYSPASSKRLASTCVIGDLSRSIFAIFRSVFFGFANPLATKGGVLGATSLSTFNPNLPDPGKTGASSASLIDLPCIVSLISETDGESGAFLV